MNSFQLRETTRGEFVTATGLHPVAADSFAKTFRAKADAFDLWPCLGVWNDRQQLMGAIIWTITQRQPHIANLQLLHTFAEYRRQGVASKLCVECLNRVRGLGAEYLRVSSEPESVAFYKSLGIQFLGRQKSGCLLAMGRLTGTDGDFRQLNYSLEHEPIRKAVFRKGKGGCVEVFK